MQGEGSNNLDFTDFLGFQLALPIGGVLAGRNILSRFAYSSRHRLLIYQQQAETEMCFLQNDTSKIQKTLDRHNPKLNLNDDLLPAPPHFRYHLPFKVHKIENFFDPILEIALFLC